MELELSVKATRFRQGGDREIINTVLTPRAYANMAHFPEEWNPLGEAKHGNRLVDKAHVQEIEEYFDTVEEKVMNALLAYGSAREFRFEPDEGEEGRAIEFGTLHAMVGARLDIGDGQHRSHAIVKHIRHLEEEGAEAELREFDRFGIPVIVVVDDDPIRRAQDFVDLQRNVKPLNSSIAYSMDRRNPTSSMLLELVQRDDLPLFDKGTRVEFHQDNPGKLSPRIASFKTVRYASGTLLIGADQRSTKGWEAAVSAVIKKDPTQATDDLVAFWQGLTKAQPFTDVLDKTKKLTVPEVRQATYLLSAGVLYACAYAVHIAHTEHGMTVKAAAEKLQTVKFNRPGREPSEDKPFTSDETIFAGNLIDPVSGKISAGRTAWEQAAERLAQAIVG